MKRIILLLSLLLFKGQVLAEVVQNAGQKETLSVPTITPIKVSELNANLFSIIYDLFKNIKKDFFEGVVSLKDFVETGEWLVAGLKKPAMRDLIGSFSLRLFLSLFVAFIIAKLIGLWLRPKIQGLLLHKDHRDFKVYKKLPQAVLLSTVSPLVFGFLLYTIFRSLTPSDELYLEIVRILSSGAAIIWILLDVARLFLKPATPEYQHIPLPQEGLKGIYIWIRRIAFVALFGFFALETGRLIRLPHAGERLLLQGSSLVIALMAIMMMVSLHKYLKEWVRQQRESTQRSRLKRAILPYLEYVCIPLAVFIVMSYISWVTPEYGRFQVIVWKGLLTLALLPLLRYGGYCIKKMRILYIHRNLKRLSETFSQRALFYGRQIDVILTAVWYFAVFIFALDLWGLEPYYFIFSKSCGLIFQKAFSILIIIAVALFLTRAGTSLLNKYLSSGQKVQDEKYKQKMARFKTISSVSRNVLRIAIWTPAFLLIIVELGIDSIPIVAPVTALIAVVGIGSQSLMRDVVTGFFMLLEDAFAVEDLIVINGQMGRVESLTVRVVRLRATDGSLYTFPYGSIASLCNQNRDFSAVVAQFQVGIEADINQVNEILEKISKDLRKDPKTRNLIVGSIQIDGINEISDHALQIRAVIKTKPSMHYKVKWAFNLLLKQYIEAYQIPSATPRQIAYNYAVEK